MHPAHNSCAASSRLVGDRAHRASDAAFRTVVIGLIGFLTLVDLFATQAILPTLARHYDVTPSAMGVAVNASTIGMAIAGLAVALFSRKIDRRTGIWASLALLAIPTALLANAGSLEVFTALRVVQGLFMAAAFTLTMAYLAEHCTAEAAAGALASYVTGGVASNLIGRLVAGLATDALGISANFQIFALLNLAGAALVFFSLKRARPMDAAEPRALSPLASWAMHLKNRSLRACFIIGFLILFSFISTFTYVNFVLVREPIGLSPMELGLVYLVFLPSMITTPLAGRFARVVGAKATFLAALSVACSGLPLLVIPNLYAVLLGLVLVGIGTFFAQATATGFIGRAAMSDRAAASGLYLASYYFGGLVGAAVIGAIFDHFGWTTSVFGIFIALALAAFLARGLHVDAAPATRVSMSRSQRAGGDHAQPV